MKKVLTALLALALALALNAQTTIPELREMAEQGTKTVKTDLSLTVVCIASDNHNLDNDNPGHYYNQTSVTPNRKTVYAQDETGANGVKLVFKKTSKVAKSQYPLTIKLKGSRLELDHGALIISGIDDKNVKRGDKIEESEIPFKALSFSELTESDYFTLVTVRGCEFVAKEGAFINVYEKYAVSTDVNKDCKPSNCMDTWARLMCDNSGRPFYMILNSQIGWRRDGTGIPAGNGRISGILVPPSITRYGGATLGKYAIRPLKKEDIAIGAESKWNTLASWTWNDGAEAVDFNAETGKGTLTVDVEANVSRGFDLDNPVVKGLDEADGCGMKPNGALVLNTQSKNWWDWENNCGKGITVATSTAGISGTSLYFYFSFAAGNLSTPNSYGFPAWWEVLYSTDGVNFTPVGEQARMLALPWGSYPRGWAESVNDIPYVLSHEAAFGFTEHMVSLPETLFGQEKLFIRVRPAGKTLSSLSYENSANMANRPNLATDSWVRFGALTVRYK